MTSAMMMIEGMSCGHCVKWVTDALTNIDGVTKVSVSLAEKKAIVEYDEGLVTVETMRSAVERAGYSVTGVD